MESNFNLKNKGNAKYERPENHQTITWIYWIGEFYWDLWRRRVHYMTPLTKMMSQRKGPIKWTKEANDAFNSIKKIVTEDTLPHYPNYDKAFEIHIDASDL